ncbi:MAG: hypothetical protein HY390_02820 [Deltaproteobacteria bacterium]|nr:hypothetical protein [Deltaproteobacteria bacterium]
MKRFFLLWLILIYPIQVLSWSAHNQLTQHALAKVSWLDRWDQVTVTSFESFLKTTFSPTFTPKDFLDLYQLNSKYQIAYKKKPGAWTSAKEILIHYSDEPDWGMDRDLNLSPDQKYMGGTQGPTSQAFRHLFLKKWTVTAPWRTFHIPLRELGEAPERAQLFFDLAQKAFEAKELYWTFRFLAWSLHYVQDLNQPFHASQLLTPRFVEWKDLTHFEKLISRTTQNISNYHFLYEYYVEYRLTQNHELSKALEGIDFFTSSSAYLLARHSADHASHSSYTLGEASFHFFGETYLSPDRNVASTPKDQWEMSKFDHPPYLTQKEKKKFMTSTKESLTKTGYFTRSLLELAKEEFLRKGRVPPSEK